MVCLVSAILLQLRTAKQKATCIKRNMAPSYRRLMSQILSFSGSSIGNNNEGVNANNARSETAPSNPQDEPNQAIIPSIAISLAAAAAAAHLQSLYPRVTTNVMASTQISSKAGAPLHQKVLNHTVSQQDHKSTNGQPSHQTADAAPPKQPLSQVLRPSLDQTASHSPHRSASGQPSHLTMGLVPVQHPLSQMQAPTHRHPPVEPKIKSFKGMELRRGKWTPEEEQYAS